jgi:hypothetical protein
VLLDGMDIYNAEYGIWRPVYERHSYHKLHFNEVPAATRYGFGNNPPNHEDEYPRPLTPVDDLPPITVITHVSQENGKVAVRGVATDNGTIRRVLVNGREARALAPNFAEWEVILEKPAAGKVRLTAHAEDTAGNVEKLGHVVREVVP